MGEWGVNNQMAKLLTEGLGNAAIKLFTMLFDGFEDAMLPEITRARVFGWHAKNPSPSMRERLIRPSSGLSPS